MLQRYNQTVHDTAVSVNQRSSPALDTSASTAARTRKSGRDVDVVGRRLTTWAFMCGGQDFMAAFILQAPRTSPSDPGGCFSLGPPMYTAEIESDEGRPAVAAKDGDTFSICAF